MNQSYQDPQKIPKAAMNQIHKEFEERYIRYKNRPLPMCAVQIGSRHIARRDPNTETPLLQPSTTTEITKRKRRRKRGSSAGQRKRNRQDQQKKRRRRPGTKALLEIRRYQRSTELLIPKAAFGRVVRDVQQHFNSEDMRWTGDALLALQEAAEAHLVRTFENSVLCSLHARRITTQVKDMQLSRRLTER